MTVLWLHMAREARLVWGGGAGALAPAVFLLSVAVVFALAMGPDPETLKAGAAAVPWTGFLVSALIVFERSVRDDIEDGTLVQMALSPHPLWTYALGKLLGRGFAGLSPGLLLVPALGIAFGLNVTSALWLLSATALGVPGVCAILMTGASLAGAARRGLLILALIALPLCLIPAIFAVGAVNAAILGETARAIGALQVTAAVSLISLTFAPFLSAAALRLHLS